MLSPTHCCLMDQTETMSHQWAAAEEMELSLSVVFCVNWGFTVPLLIQGSLLKKKKKIFSCTAVMLSCYIYIQTKHQVNGHVAGLP